MDQIETKSYDSLDDLYKSIDEEGSLGILALGATGIQLWRKKRDEMKQKQYSDEDAK